MYRVVCRSTNDSHPAQHKSADRGGRHEREGQQQRDGENHGQHQPDSVEGNSQSTTGVPSELNKPACHSLAPAADRTLEPHEDRGHTDADTNSHECASHSQ